MAEQQVEEKVKAGVKGVSAKTVVMLAGVLGLEALAISAAFLLSGGPADVEAAGAGAGELAAGEQPVEFLVLADSFQNTRSGKMFMYDTEIYVVVKGKHLNLVRRAVENMNAAISTEVATIFRRADPSHLSEPTLATLTRQIKAALDTKLHDADDNPVILEVLVRKCTQLPIY